MKCHGSVHPRSGLNLEALPTNFRDAGIAAKWADVVTVMNGHQMPPASAKQPPAAEAGRVIDWISSQLASAEVAKRSAHVVLRRLNRAEYNNTIRDLVGVDFHPADQFPEDPPAGGFDNIGQALTVSPMQIELYYKAANQILDRALVEGPRPPTIKWHFEPRQNTEGMDRLRVKRDGQDILLNSGANPIQNGFTMVHHDSWDKVIEFRGFKVPSEGEYIIRFRAAGRTPSRIEVADSAEMILKQRFDEAVKANPAGKRYAQEALDSDLLHFKTHRAYDYGPPRIRVVQHLGSAPLTVAEMDIEAKETDPKVYEVPAHFTTQDAGVEIHYAYDIPKYLENFWLQGKDEFARPTLLFDWVELEGPMHPVWPSASHKQLLGDLKEPVTNEGLAVRKVLKRFMPLAFRRPVSSAEIEEKVALFSKHRGEASTFTEALKVPLSAVLASPNFLYLVEQQPSESGSQLLSGYELASRLSYFFWSSMPDEELLSIAAKGKLQDSGVLIAQMNRMLASPKCDSFIKNFVDQWLGVRKVGANPPAMSLYPDYDRHLETSIVGETEGFFKEILQKDLDARDLIKSDFVTVNERLARFYGIPGVRGDAIRVVRVPPSVHRGGLLTQASILTTTSNGTRTSPVTRGVWVLRTLLGSDPGLPIANVGEIPSKVPGIDRATVRVRLQIHRQNPSCARCHDKIDPLGFALENYNACGEWREREGHGYQGRIEADDPLIDAASTMPDGTAIRGIEGLQDQLLKKQNSFFNTLASQLATYAMGRQLGFSDHTMLVNAVSNMKQHGNTLRSLIGSIITSPQFRSR